MFNTGEEAVTPRTYDGRGVNPTRGELIDEGADAPANTIHSTIVAQNGVATRLERAVMELRRSLKPVLRRSETPEAPIDLDKKDVSSFETVREGIINNSIRVNKVIDEIEWILNHLEI